MGQPNFNASLNKDHIREMYPCLIQQMQTIRQFMAQFLAGYLAAVLAVIGVLSAINQPGKNVALRITLTIIITLVSVGYWIFLKRMAKMFGEFAGVIRVIDRFHEVYTTGAFVVGEKLYPARWEKFGTSKWTEPLFSAAWYFSILSYLVGIFVLWFSVTQRYLSI
jgi:hypothetical protein